MVTLLPVLAGACSDQLGIGRTPKVSVVPREVVYHAATPQADPYAQTVTVKNVGTLDLQVALGMAGDAQFQPAWTDNQFSLAPQQSRDLIINYFAADTLAHRAELRIQSNDPQNAKITVPVSNDDISPRIVVTDCVRPDGGGDCIPPIDDLLVDFGTVRAGQCKQGTITVDNIGPAPLNVDAPAWQPGSSPDIAFDGPAPGAFTVNAPDDNGNTNKMVLHFKYCPTMSTSATATLVLNSNDPNNPRVLVAFQGGAVIHTPPVCMCNPSTIEAAPLDTITLSGAGCSDADGSPLQYTWTVEARPPGSTAPLRNANSRDATFFVDLATNPTTPYVFKVTATNTGGQSASCEYTVFAIPRDALHVQMVWDTDGNDLDLHLLNQVGSADRAGSNGWFNLVNDCYYRNCAGGGLDWGVAGFTPDNPRLDIDNVVGYGPENINIAQPASGRYTVGVHYYCSNGVGPSHATVRIYCMGVEKFESNPPETMTDTGFFWDVVFVDWPGCVITPLGTTRTVTEGCLGP
jgi:uncharacterized protein YfaP (DUF2135 family)